MMYKILLQKGRTSQKKTLLVKKTLNLKKHTFEKDRV